MRKPLAIEIRRLRGPTRTADALRRAAVTERAATSVKAILASLEDQPSEFAFEVCRAIVRQLAATMATLANPARSVGVLGGASAEVAPAYEPQAERERLRAAADRALSGGAA